MLLLRCFLPPPPTRPPRTPARRPRFWPRHFKLDHLLLLPFSAPTHSRCYRCPSPRFRRSRIQLSTRSDRHHYLSRAHRLPKTKGRGKQSDDLTSPPRRPSTANKHSQQSYECDEFLCSQWPLQVWLHKGPAPWRITRYLPAYASQRRSLESPRFPPSPPLARSHPISRHRNTECPSRSLRTGNNKCITPNTVHSFIQR